MLLLLAQATGGNPARIDQLTPPAASSSVRRLPTGPDKRSQAATVAQLPTTLEPVTAEHEERLIPAESIAAAGNAAAAEIARAVAVIRGRGQVPTPEVLAREVGPEVLDAYLARINNVAALSPATTAPRADPEQATLPGTTIIPPGGKP